MDEELERYESEVELQTYREFRDVAPMFRFLVETERHRYLANRVDLHRRESGGNVYFEIDLEDAWVWDVHRPVRFLKRAKVITFGDVHVEEAERSSAG
ncbi:MAG: hypothetical protein KatS3mg011_1324 [Acidimicrobiia bacterium]|jgi:hypothetical protein|nr:MAG: hypothetical protein KatS3mg011_1324 [Acidimicrobiia bacterium]